MSARSPLVLTAVLAALGAAGCGLGAGKAPGGARLVVTENFGHDVVARPGKPRVGGSDTVIRFLARNAKVTTRYGGGFVQSIDGRAGGRRGARPVDWFYYVNGIEAETGGGQRKLRPDDVVWWDRHDWGTTMSVPAVVGSFPEPFLHGPEGKRLPVRVECAEPQAPVCDAVQKRLTDVGVLAAQGGLQRSLTMNTVRVVVGRYAAVRDDEAVRQLEQGPRVSGVYAQPAADGRSIATLDAQGHVVQRLGPGSGLVAAVRLEGGQPVWIVTGTDDAGVALAATTLRQDLLRDHFAVAAAVGRTYALPAGTPAG